MTKRREYTVEELTLVAVAIARIFGRYRERAIALCADHPHNYVVQEVARAIGQSREAMYAKHYGGGYEIRPGQQLIIWRDGHSIGDPPDVTISLVEAIRLIFADPRGPSFEQPCLWDELAAEGQAHALGAAPGTKETP